MSRRQRPVTRNNPRYWKNFYTDEKVVPLARHKSHLVITDRIWDAMQPPTEFYLFFFYGPLGYGKSALAIFVLVELLMNWYKLRERDAWELAKQYIVFHPQQFFDKLDEMDALGLPRVPMILWDDAGLWLYALEWNDPFVKTLGKWMNVARTALGGMVMTTPTPKIIVKKIRSLPNTFRVNLIKYTRAPRTRWLRQGKIYEDVDLPDMVKSRTYLRGWVKINIYIPDEFYRWYEPLRDHYEKLARSLMKDGLARSRKKSAVPMLSDFPELHVPAITDPRDASYNMR